MEARADGEQLPGHTEMYLGAGDTTGEEVVDPPGTDLGTWEVRLAVKCRSAEVGPHGEGGVVLLQRCGQSVASVARSAVGRHRHRAQLRGRRGAQRQVDEHLGAGRADERVVVLAEVVFEVALAHRCLAVGVGSGRGKGRLAGVQRVVDSQEEVVPGPHGGSDQDAAVRIRAEDLAPGLQLRPPVAQGLEVADTALSLDQPVRLLRLVPSPQVRQLPLGVLEGGAQGGDGAAEFEVLGLPQTQQRAADPLGHRHAQPVGGSALRGALGAVRVDRVQRQALARGTRHGGLMLEGVRT